MPTYEYECSSCSLQFERRQGMNDKPVEACPECGGKVRRLVSGGTGFLMKDMGGRSQGECLLETTGRTCCGAASRCSEPRCGE